MRTWIYNRVVGLGDALPAGMAQRVYGSGAPENPIKPFLLVQMDVEQAPLGMPASARAQQIPFTIWVHDDPGSMLHIDDAAVALKNGIPTEDGLTVGGMSVYGVAWVETGQDAYDDFFKTSARPVRFTMMTRR